MIKKKQQQQQKQANREHWMQRITFAAETNAADTHTAWRRASQYFHTFTR